MTKGRHSLTELEWERLKSALAAALESAPDERERVLEEALAGWEHLMSEARSLLAMQGSGDVWLEGQSLGWTMPVAANRQWIGQRIGPWRLERELGTGGMGVVYLAEREDGQFRARAAVKLLRHGADSESLSARFRNERQVLATLQHPGIARLLDGGVTEQGRPYLVMEYIEGVPIDRYSAERELGLRARLGLFCQVAGAVQYAHSHLVVHRDLKPANILVTAQGEVKLLDFGISKILAPEIAAVALETRLEQGRPLTPGYASPEQLAGDPVTTTSDIYSLGVLLHTLLTERMPRRREGRLLKPSECVRFYSREETSANRHGVGSRGSQVDSATLAEVLVGDLDSIILMALRDEAVHRYASAQALADDVRRYLGDLPVLARRNSFGYHLGKFIRRHRVATVVAAVSAAGLFGTTLMAVDLAQRAEKERLRADQRFGEVRKLAGDMIFKHHESLRTVPGASVAREALLKDALNYLDRLATDAGDNPGLQVEIATGYMQIAQIQGEEFSTNLGKFAEARANVAKSLALLEKIDFDQNKPLAEERNLLGQAYIGSGMLALQAGDARAALGFYEKSRDFYAKRVDAEPDSKLNLEWLAASHYRIGEVKGFSVLRLSLGETADAKKHLLEGLALRERMLAKWPQDDYVMHQVAQSVGALGLWHWHYGNADEAEAYLERTIRIREDTLKAKPDFSQYQRDMVAAQVRLADVRSDHGQRVKEAIDAMRAEERRAAALAEQDRADFNAARDLTGVRLAYVRVLLRAGKAREAAQFVADALTRTEPSVGGQNDFYASAQWLQALFNASELALQQGDAARARSYASRAQETTARLLENHANHANIRLFVAQADSLRMRAELLAKPERACSAARVAFDNAQRQWEAVPPAMMTHQARALRDRMADEMKAC